MNSKIIQFIESMHETCLFFYDYRLIYVNTKAPILYWPIDNIVGKTLGEIIPLDISDKFLKTYRETTTSPPQSCIETSEHFQPNKCFQFFFYPCDSGFLVCFDDITVLEPLISCSRHIVMGA